MSFVHLHVHTEASHLDGLARMRDVFSIARDAGQDAIAVTDHGTLGGIWRAKKASQETGVKLIPGIELYIALTEDGRLGDREKPAVMKVATKGADDSDDDDGVKGKRYFHLTLLAATREGWHNMVRVVNASERSKFGKYSLADINLIAQHSAGLIVLTGCLGGPVLGPLSDGDRDTAERNLEDIVAAVGRDNVYLEVMEHGIAEESAVLGQMDEIGAKFGIPLVATNDSHYSHDHDAHVHDAWLALRTRSTINDPKRYRFSGDGYHIRTEAEMRALRAEPWWQLAVENTQYVAARVADDVVPDGSPKLPVFPTPEGYPNNAAYLKALLSEAADRTFGTPRPAEVSERLNFEWRTVASMGFIDYFLILHDVVSWARDNDILVGPGRGSAAGSLIAYLLGITSVNPLEHDLLFERFLEPGRADFPDIDVDFERERRDDILDYLESKWGEGHVAAIGTASMTLSKRAIQDAARLLEKPRVGDALSKLVPIDGGKPLTFEALLDEANEQTAPFRREVERLGEDARRVLEMAQGFAGIINGASVHACGIVVSDQYLPDLIPLRVHKNGRWVTQWDSRDVEGFGLLKLDILALRNLDIAHQAMDYIRETTGEALSLATIPPPWTKGDPRVDRTWELLRTGRTAGVFQMEGAAMTALAQDVQPDGIDDLSAILALFRPGPISARMPERYALRKNGKEAVDYGIYTDDATEQQWIATQLGKTYGVLAYQEQMMLLSTTVAGFDAVMRSKLRKAIGKKDAELMAAIKDSFIEGAQREIRDEAGTLISPAFAASTADGIWAMFEGAAAYAFNASHSYAYAYLAYYTAFLKANWPGAYGAAILAKTTDSKEKRLAAFRSLPSEGISVLPPDVNLSGTHSRPEGDTAVRLGLSEISGFGSSAEWVIRTRERSGEFTSFTDFVHRVRIDDIGNRTVPVNNIMQLIEAGAMDRFGPRLGLATISRVASVGLLAPVPNLEWGVLERSARQRARLGVSLGEHPLSVFQEQVRSWRREVHSAKGDVLMSAGGIPVAAIPELEGTAVVTIGLLASWTEGSYKKGRKVAFTLEGSRESISGVMWDRELTDQKSIGVPRVGWPVAVTAKVRLREFETEGENGELLITRVKELTALRFDQLDINDPIVGSYSDQSVIVPDMTGAAPEATPEAVAEPAPGPAPVVEPAPEPVFDQAAEEDEPHLDEGSWLDDPDLNAPAEAVAVTDEPTAAPGEVPTLHLPAGIVYRAAAVAQLPPELREATWEPPFQRGAAGEHTLLNSGGEVVGRVVLG